jgi:hypothetical protein
MIGLIRENLASYIEDGRQILLQLVLDIINLNSTRLILANAQSTQICGNIVGHNEDGHYVVKHDLINGMNRIPWEFVCGCFCSEDSTFSMSSLKFGPAVCPPHIRNALIQ